MTSSPADRVFIGLGCSSAASPDEIASLILACLAEAGISSDTIAAFGTHVRKRDSMALLTVAERFGVALRYLDDGDLSADHSGTCEAVAGAAGSLVLAKRKSRYATCAIAQVGADFDSAAFGQPASPSAVIASSTLVTSWAGP